MENTKTSVQLHLEEILKIRSSVQSTHGYHYSSIEDFVLQEGRSFEPKPLPKHIQKMQMKMCFMNAFQLATTYNNYKYVEGYASGIIPVQHAWCVDDDGNVVDPTWVYDPEDSYYGVEFNTNFLIRRVIQKGSYGLIDDWENGWPLLKTKFDRSSRF